MKPNILSYFCMRALFHLVRNSGNARQKECILTWGHNSCNHKHPHSHFAHNPLFKKFLSMPGIHYMSAHFWCSTPLIQVWGWKSPPCVLPSLSTGNTLQSQWLGAPSMSNTIKSHCRDRINTVIYCWLLWRKCLRRVVTQKPLLLVYDF